MAAPSVYTVKAVKRETIKNHVKRVKPASTQTQADQHFARRARRACTGRQPGAQRARRARKGNMRWALVPEPAMTI